MTLEPVNKDLYVQMEVRDISGNLLMKKTVQQIFRIENGLIRVFEIGDTEPNQ